MRENPPSVEGPAETSFGGQLRLLRERAALTQEELAERAGLTPHAISALERGTRTRPYPHTVRSLANALALSDSDRTRLVAAVPVRSGATSLVSAPDPARAERSVASPGLAVPSTSIYGREDDITALVNMVRNGASRLISLTGPGGVGKTRLVAAAAEALAPEFPDGVVQLALAPLVDPAAVVATIGRALGLSVGDAANAIDAVTEYLRTTRVLMVLDNFEHLLSAAPDVGLLASRCPDLTVLVASRAPLRVRGEREYPVMPLALPAKDVATVEDLTGSPAGALMLDRARDVAPRLATGPAEIRALGLLCERLAGIPLAIELATARLRLLSPQVLLERLDDVMTGAGARDLPERQRSIRATLDWSYGLLDQRQQTLFRILGAFRAGATPAAIEDVVTLTGQLPRQQVLELLEGLAEQSLVTVRIAPDGEHRVDMLEPVAQYARSLLVGEELTRAARAHAQVYRELADRAAIGLEHADQVLWLARTAADEANLLVAIDRSLDLGDSDIAGGITWAMWLYWWLRGQPSVGRKRAEQCLAASDLTPAVRGRVHLAAACMAYAAGDVPSSAEHWAEALRVGTEAADPEIMCKATAGVGLAEIAERKLDAAAVSLKASLPLAEAAGDAGIWLRSLVHVWLGTVLLLQGKPGDAHAETHLGLKIARDRGDRLATYIALYTLSQIALAGGDYPQARAHLVEGIRLSEETRDVANLAHFLESLAVVESADGTALRAATLIGAAQSLREDAGANVYGYYVPDESLRARAEGSARELLGFDAYDDAIDHGRSFGMSEAIRFAVATSVDS